MEKTYSYCTIITKKELQNCDYYTTHLGEQGEIVKFIFNIVKINESDRIYKIFIIVYNCYDTNIIIRVQNLIISKFEPIAYSWLNQVGDNIFLKIYSK